MDGVGDNDIPPSQVLTRVIALVMLSRQRVLIGLLAAFAAAWRVRRHSRGFRYLGHSDPAIAATLLAAGAPWSGYAFHFIPVWLQGFLRGRLQRTLDGTTMVLGASQMVVGRNRHRLADYFSRQWQCGMPYHHTGAQLDVLSRDRTGSRPVVIFVHGGAWGSGNKLMYRGLGVQGSAPLADGGLDAVWINVGYRVWPKGDVHDQVEHVIAAVRWAQEHIHEHGGDPEQLHLCGHSSGGHVCVLAVMQEEMRARLRSVVPISGVYDIVEHYRYESGRGVEKVSTMAPACGDDEASFRAVSPTLLAPTLSAEALLSLPPLYILHGEADTTVPVQSSRGLSDALIMACVRHGLPSDKVVLEVVQEGGGHTDVITDPLGITPGPGVMFRTLKRAIDSAGPLPRN